MAISTRHIGISLGHITHFHDGLGEFSRQYGNHIAAYSKKWQKEFKIQLHFHLPEKWHGAFGDNVSYLATHPTQRHFHWQPNRFDIWHQLNQHVRIRPPLGTHHCITTLHDLNMVYVKQGFSRWLALKKQIRLLEYANEIVCISDYVLSDLRNHTKINKPASRIYNGVNSLVDEPQKPISEIAGRKYLLHIGRMTPNKNVGRLIDLAEHWPEQYFVFAGPRNGHTEEYERLAQLKELRNTKFIFDVSEPQKAWLYANCDALLMPSITEGFGLPVIEAMYFGKPVIISRLTSLPEIGGENAIYFDNFDPKSMKQVISAGIQNKKNPASTALIKEWAQNFTWERCIENYVKRYSEALGLRL